MNASELERALTYPLGDHLPAQGTATLVAPGIKWLRIGLPFALDHINLWLVRDHFDGRDGWAVVDTCVSQPHAHQQWEQVFESALEGQPIVRVIVTHMHPDHVGNAKWLCERWGATLHMSATDYLSAKLFSQSTSSEQGGEKPAEFLRSHGLLDDASLTALRARTSYYPDLVPGVPESYVRLHDGLVLQMGQHRWRCIAGYGHAPEHIALYCAELNVLLSGDMVLPRISTNVSVHAGEPQANALQQFLDSLHRYDDLPADVLVLPAHGKPFTGIHVRLQQLHDHHRDRLADLLVLCQTQPTTAHDALPVLFNRQLDLHQTTFAMGESIAHLHKLWYDGAVSRELGPDGVYRFSAR